MPHLKTVCTAIINVGWTLGGQGSGNSEVK